MRTVRVRMLLALATLNIFVLAAGVVALDVVASRPGDPVAYPVAFAQDKAAAHLPEAPPVDPDRLADRLDDRMSDTGLGDGLSGYVADGTTGEQLYGRNPDDAVTPASTTKVATAVAVLASAGPDHRIATRAVFDGERLILVGGGDPTLTPEADDETYPRPATLRSLAEKAATELTALGVDSVPVGYDDSLYPGPDTGPGWKDNYVWEGSVAPVHALMIDGGRSDANEHYGEREGNPPLAAANAFADQLDAAGIAVDGDPEEAEAPAEDDADATATVFSSPLSALVERMMLESDNNIAEALARQVAIAEGEEPSFEGGSAATRAVLDELGVQDVHVEDGSGLSVDNRISPRGLVEMLLAAADPDRPDLSFTISGLPTAHFSGTLSGRYDSGESGRGAGVVRGKTGTLSGVSTLAGTVYDADGRLLMFAFMANDPAASGSALDTLAAEIAACGCS